MQDKNPLVRVPPETRKKLEHIKTLRRWNLGVVVDEAVNRFAEVEGIKFPASVGTRRPKVPA